MSARSNRCPFCGEQAPAPLGAMLRPAIGGLRRWDCPHCRCRLQFKLWPSVAGRAIAFAPTLVLLTLADFAGRFSGALIALAALVYVALYFWVYRNLVSIERVDPPH